MIKLNKGLQICIAVVTLVLLIATNVMAAPPDGRGRPGGGGDDDIRWRYTALGDSLATGFLATRGYVPRYADHLEGDNGADVRLTNLGVNGMTSDELLDALKHDRKFRREVSRADVVTWNIGGNDFRLARRSYKEGDCESGGEEEACLKETQENFKANWVAIIDEILQLRSEGSSIGNTIIRTMNVYNPFVDEDQEDGTFGVFKPYIDELNAFMCSEAAGKGIPCADVYKAFNGPEGDKQPDRDLLAIDNFHPSDKGHQLIAALLQGLGYEPLGNSD